MLLWTWVGNIYLSHCFHYFWYIAKNEFKGSYSNSMFRFCLGNYLTVLQSGYTILLNFCCLKLLSSWYIFIQEQKINTLPSPPSVSIYRVFVVVGPGVLVSFYQRVINNSTLGEKKFYKQVKNKSSSFFSPTFNLVLLPYLYLFLIFFIPFLQRVRFQSFSWMGGETFRLYEIGKDIKTANS